jgi:hypothetical protein
MTRRRLVVISLSAVVAVGLAWAAGSYIHTRIFWPGSIQHSLLGTQVVDYADLVTYSDDRTIFGEGFLKWRYVIRGDERIDPRLCRRFAAQGCSFGISRALNEGVTLEIEVIDGQQVEITEIWS